ncbi:ABC transporter permease [Rhodospirillum rubrum]|uniref:ABC3 transporter permease protein domain-containing protein n=1 Tax=Rhodospirillum rubrum (strain ATCC 11170 / ATH 1.1.1 / DSM 467 / LMG 4362 / NCIMB 8255 / S1) TaxID=269796 RepID=Q2RN48_RHORT|nr:FtsX-like permease family protein [Rhodospirillum rubrum]ABC24447.1 Protein of unknown function DUF214 [Rhodospirillum rubrum ATCC 11170]AEO50198.1 hypothetical protein F11_18690 [Rhodospirillum rubrum F11]MBK5956167.1 glycosyl transferase family 1 [Rhodospirillum rubrum]QXG80369.1 ABC transporter permease [Rhodospirillum rubrum]HAP99595.1 glycosyl transferase family 1 [Rhodospirillum rubrum]
MRSPGLTSGPVALRFALRELRAGLSGFRVLIACLAIGVAAIAAAGSVNRAIDEGLSANARQLLGGDLELRLMYRDLSAAEIATLERLGTLTRYTEMRAMVRPETNAEGRRLLVEMKGVEPGYPLYGAVELTDGQPLAGALAERDGLAGAVAAPALADRLGIKVGDRLRVGDAVVELRGVIAREPDAIGGAFSFGPRLMVAAPTVAKTGLIQPGSLVEYHGLLRLEGGSDLARAKDILAAEHPQAGWRLRGPEEAGAGAQRFLDRLTLFLVLVGLTSLLVGGIGVANAVKAYLDGRIRTIAVLKCLGAPAGLIFRVYMIQIGLISLAGVGIGLLIGAALPPLAIALLADLLPVPAEAGVFAGPLLLAAAFGLLTALVFSLGALSRARDIPATALFRGESAKGRGGRWRDRLMIAAGALTLAALAVATADDKPLAAWFVAGAGLALLLFRGAAALVGLLAKAAGRPSGLPALRLALTNLHRPGAATTSVVLSLGLGLSVLVAIALIQGNLDRQIREGIPAQAPTFFFIDIQPQQTATFEAAVHGADPGAKVVLADMIRGRIRAFNGVPVAEERIAPEARWAVRGDRGFSTAETLPEGSTLQAGAWWPADYQGPPLFSLTSDLAEGMGLAPGDAVTVNILGRDLTGTLANTRKVDWGSLTMNFAFVVSPGAFAGAPRSYIATVRASEALASDVDKAVAAVLPNVSAIRVRDALDTVTAIMEGAGNAVRISALLTLIAGAVVLGGAFAANHGRRLREAVTLKVLGATRGQILRAYLTEYGILGLATGLIAALVGSVAAWGVLVFALRADWVLLPGVVATTAVGCVLATMAAGLAGTWRALGAKAAPFLRNE